MKTIVALFAILGAATCTFAQGEITFANSSSTLISANGTPMPVSGAQQFIFAIFLAPSTTVNGTGQIATFLDPAFQVVGAYNTNSETTLGRINTRANIDVGSAGGWAAGSTVDFIIRGWSLSAGANWSEALANWNNGTPLVPMFIGASTVGNNVVLVLGPVPSTTVFGTGPNQVPGFNMVGVPEPSMFAIAGIGAAALWLFRRR